MGLIKHTNVTHIPTLSTTAATTHDECTATTWGLYTDRLSANRGEKLGQG